VNLEQILQKQQNCLKKGNEFAKEGDFKQARHLYQLSAQSDYCPSLKAAYEGKAELAR
jgi:hypothetical protein